MFLSMEANTFSHRASFAERISFSSASSCSSVLLSAAAEEAEEEDAEDAEDAPCPQAARLKASTRLSESAVTRLNFMVLLLCCFGI